MEKAPRTDRLEARRDGALRGSGTGLVLFAGVCLSTAPAAIKLALSEGADPYRLLAWRLALGWVVLAAAVLVFRPALLRIDRRGLMHCGIAGGLNTLSLLCFYLALRTVDASIATFTFSLYPAATLLLLAVARERISRMSLGRLLLAGLGAWLVIGPGGAAGTSGFLLLMVTVFVFSLHLVWIQWHLTDYRSLTIACWVLGSMAFSSLAIALPSASAVPLGNTAWAVIVWTGLLATAVARLAMFAGIRRIGSGQTALLAPFEILLSVLWAVLLLGETRSPLEWLGGGLILVSAGLAAAEPRSLLAGYQKHPARAKPVDPAPG